MLDRTDDSSVAADNWLAPVRGSAGEAGRRRAEGPVPSRQLLARRAGAELEHPDPERRRRHPEGAAAAGPQHGAQRLCRRPRSRRAAQGDARGHQRDRSHLQVRDQGRARQRHHPPDPGCGRRQPPQGLDAADRAWRTQRLRGTTRRPAPARQRLFARLSRPQLARPAQGNPPAMPTAIRPCSSSAADNPGSPSPRG